MPKLVFYYCRENRYSVNALAAALDCAGIEALEMRFPGTRRDFVSEALAAGPGSAAAVSFFSYQKKTTAQLAAELRARPGLALIAGGPHASARPQEALQMGFDYAVSGEGEEALSDLMRGLVSGRPPARGVIRGRPLKTLDKFPSFPARRGLFGPIEITRGCPFACSYCQTSYIFGNRPRHRSVAGVLVQISALLDAGIRDVRFTSPDAFGYGSHDGRELDLPALRSLLSGAGALAEGRGGRLFFGSFPSEVRPEHVTEETLQLAKAHVSNRRLIIGAQTGSPRLLKAIRRGHSPGDILRSCDLCRKFGFTPYFDFIFGLPGETRADELATETLIEELSARGAMIHTHAFMPLPGTPLAELRGPGITPTARAFLEKMEAKGKAFGKWRAQLEMNGY
jgi:B12-binding domain/radical SAM domain protein